MIEQREAAPYYFRYIDLVPNDNILRVLETQGEETLSFLNTIEEERSLYRYAPDKWSIRQVLNHLSDVERLFVFRAFWFARGFGDPLPSFDQDSSSAASQADRISWSNHVEEFRAVRTATLSFFQNLPEEGWSRKGIASDNPFTVRALAYIVAGHTTHHLTVIKERYM